MKFILAVVAFAVVSAGTSAQQLVLPNSTRVDAGFSPGGEAEGIILQAISSARSSVLVSAYTFTNRRIGNALLSASRRGVKVGIVADLERNKQANSELGYLARQGVPVRLNGNYLDKHSKFLVVDGSSVETGSFNYSEASAKRNEENVIYLHDVPKLAAIFQREWLTVWQQGQDLK